MQAFGGYAFALRVYLKTIVSPVARALLGGFLHFFARFLLFNAVGRHRTAAEVARTAAAPAPAAALGPIFLRENQPDGENSTALLKSVSDNYVSLKLLTTSIQLVLMISAVIWYSEFPHLVAFLPSFASSLYRFCFAKRTPRSYRTYHFRTSADQRLNLGHFLGQRRPLTEPLSQPTT